MQRLNPPPVLRTLCVGLGLALVLLAAWEVHARSIPRTPSNLTAAVAAAWRVEAAPTPGTRRVLIMGSSRSLCGINPDQMQPAIGEDWNVVLAGFHAGHGTRQLAEAEDLLRPGDVVLVDVLPETDFACQGLSSTEVYFRARARARDPLQSIEVVYERRLRSLLASKLTRATPMTELRSLARGGLGLAPTGQLVWHVHDSGWQELVSPVSEQQTDSERRLLRKTPESSHSTWIEVVDELARLVHRARGRGIEVAFLRMPSDGAYEDFERQAYPRPLYWDELARRFPGRCWHFEDFAETRDLKTIDGSHLYHEHTEAYTRWLAGQLKATVLHE